MLVIGIHREELAFGRLVAESLNPEKVHVLPVPEGISGQRPRADQHFKYAALHRALYLQLLPYVQGRHRLLLDLHAGSDPSGPSADLICAAGDLRGRIEAAVAARPELLPCNIRVIPLGDDTTFPHAHTVIPKQVWRNAAFVYLGMEIYLPETHEGLQRAIKLGRGLVELVGGCVCNDETAETSTLSAQQGLAVSGQMHSQTGHK
nr:hypothetical protein [Methylomonas sp. WSC-6]